MSTQRAMTTSTIAVTILLFVSKIFGFLRETAISAYFGASYSTDAYVMAYSIPTMVQSAFTACILATFIPMYSRIRHEDGEIEANRFTSNMLNSISLLGIGIAVVLFVFAPQIISIFQFEAEKAALTVQLTRIMTPMLFVVGAMALFQSYLNANKSFIGPQLVGFPYSICIMAGCFLFAKTIGVNVLAYATLIGTVLQLLLLIPFLFKRFKYSWMLDWKDPRMQRTFKLMLPALVSIATVELNTFIDRFLASGLQDGAISAIHFSTKLNNFIIGTLSVSVVTVLYSHLSGLSAKKDMAGLKRESMRGFRLLFTILAPTVVVAVLSASDVVSVAFERGVFGASDTDITAYAFMFYAPSILATGLRDIMTRTFFAMGNTRTPTINGIISMVINIVLNIILVRFMGVGGLALATSIALFSAAFLMLLSMRKKMGTLGIKALMPQYVRLLISLLAQVAAVLLLNGVLSHWHTFARLVTVGAVSLLVYAGVGYALKMDTIVLVLQRGLGMVGRMVKKALRRPDRKKQD